MFVQRLTEVRSQLGNITAELDTSLLSGTDAARTVTVCGEIERLAAGARALAAARVDQTRAWSGSGHQSAAHWLAKQSGTSVGEAGAALRTGKQLEDLPHTRSAVRTGKLSLKQAELVAQGATADGHAEPGLLKLADDASLGELRKESQRAIANADTDQAATHRRIWRNRYFRHRRDADGAWVGTIRTTADAGSLLLAAIADTRKAVFNRARRSGHWDSAEAYDADALIELARLHLTGEHGADDATQHRRCHATDPTPSPPGDPTDRAARGATPAPGDDAGRPSGSCDNDRTTANRDQPTNRTERLTGDTKRPSRYPATDPPPAAASEPTSSAFHAEASPPPTPTSPEPGSTSAPAAAPTPDRATEPAAATASAGATATATDQGPVDAPVTTPQALPTSAIEPPHPSATATATATATEARPASGTTPSTPAGPPPSAETPARTAGTAVSGPTAILLSHFPGATLTDPTSDGRLTASFEPDGDPPKLTEAPPSPARRHSGSQAATIIRIDHSALVRGHTLPGETCEITGIGPIAVPAVQHLLPHAFLAAVTTDHTGEVATVAHLERRSRLARLAAQQHPPPTDIPPAPGRVHSTTADQDTLAGIGAATKIIVRFHTTDHEPPPQGERRSGRHPDNRNQDDRERRQHGEPRQRSPRRHTPDKAPSRPATPELPLAASASLGDASSAPSNGSRHSRDDHRYGNDDGTSAPATAQTADESAPPDGPSPPDFSAPPDGSAPRAASQQGATPHAAPAADAFETALRDKGTPVGALTHHRRAFTALQRTALQYRQPACAVIGCTASARLELDHRHDWSATHTTDATCGDHLCHFHHKLKTLHGWHLEPGTGKRRFLPPPEAPAG